MAPFHELRKLNALSQSRGVVQTMPNDRHCQARHLARLMDLTRGTVPLQSEKMRRPDIQATISVWSRKPLHAIIYWSGIMPAI